MSFYKREDPDPEDWTPRHSDRTSYKCRQCDRFLGHHGVQFWNGWPWCPTHYKQMVALAMGQPQPETEEDAAEHFKQRTSR